jgi:type III pantothenate kinase
VSQGAKHAAAALIERAIDAMRVPLQTTPILLLTGGAATGLEQLIETPCVAVPDLVLRGLSVIVNAEIS